MADQAMTGEKFRVGASVDDRTVVCRHGADHPKARPSRGPA